MPLDDEQAITFLRRWFDEIWREGKLDVLDQLYHDPYARHTSQGSETISIAEYRKRVVQSQRVLHGAATTIDDYVASGDKIWARATSRGVNLETVGPNTITWMTCFRMVEGKVAEAWIATLAGVDWEA